MLMLMRSEGSEGSSASETDCDDPLVALACELWKSGCPAACASEKDEEPTVVKAGDLVVTATAAGERKALIGWTSDLDTLTFKTSEEVSISKVTLERYGYSANKNISQLWLEDEDGNVISNKVENFNSKGQANLSIKKEYRTVDGVMNATIVVVTEPTTVHEDAVLYASKDEYNAVVDPGVDDAGWAALTDEEKTKTPARDVANPDAPVAGSTLGFKVVAVESTAANLNLDDYTPYTYDMVVYNGVNVTLSSRAGSKNYDFVAGDLYEVSKFKIEAPVDSAILVKGFTLENEGWFSDVEKYLDEFNMTIAWEKAKASYSFNKDDELVISLDKDLKIAAKDKAEVIIEMSFTSDFNAYGNSISYRITPTTVTQFNAIDSKTESRVQVTNNTSTFTYTFNGGKVRLSSTKLGAVDAAIKTSDVKVAEWEISLAEAIKVAKNKVKITVTSSYGNVSGIIERLVLVIDGEEYEWTRWTDWTTVEYSFPAIEIEESGKVQVLLDTLEAPAYEKSTLTLTMDGWDWFYYSEDKSAHTSAADIVAGSLTFSKVTIQWAKSTLSTNGLKSNVEFKNKQADQYSVYEGTFTAKKADVKLNSFTVTWDNTVLVNEDALKDAGKALKVTFHLYLDGDEVADEVLSWDTTASRWIANEDFRDVVVKAGESVAVKLVAEVDATRLGTLDAAKNLWSFAFWLDGVDDNDTPIDQASRSTSAIKVVESGTPTVSDASGRKTVLLKAAGKEIAQFTIKPANGASELEIDSLQFDVTVSGWDTVSTDDLIVTIDNEDKEVAAYKAAAATLGDVLYDNLLVKTDEDGVIVKIVLDAEIAWTITINDLKVNGIGFPSRSYEKRFEDAVVTLHTEDKDGTTKIYLWVEKYEPSTKVSKVVITTDQTLAAAACSNPNHTTSDTCVAPEVWSTYKTYSLTNDEVSDGDDFEVPAATDKSTHFVTAIQYCVGDGSCADAANGLVSITKNDYSDYFKDGDSSAKIVKVN